MERRSGAPRPDAEVGRLASGSSAVQNCGFRSDGRQLVSVNSSVTLNATYTVTRIASDPCVLQDGGTWAFYYFSLDSKRVARDLLATGRDLLHPEKCKQIIVDVCPPGSVDSIYAHKPSLIQHKGDLYHFCCAVSRQNGKTVRGISVARSRPWP